MDDIMKLKKLHSSYETKTVLEAVDQYVSVNNHLSQANEVRLAEDQQKIEHLSQQLSIAEDKLIIEKKILEEKVKELKVENEKLEDLVKKRNKLKKMNDDLERRCNKLRFLKPNARDEHILEHGQKKLNLFKELTRIRWDFAAIEEETKGLICDKKMYLKTFRYPKDIQGEELSDLLWQEIELSTKTKFPDDGNKEKSLLIT